MNGFRIARLRMSVLAWGLCAVATLPLRLAHAGEGEGEQPYTVQCKAGAASAADCQVDKKTYIGWRTYHANCHVCHAQDAVGSSFAPSLIQRIQEISKEQYMNSVVNGYTGQIGVMPGWKDNPNVNKRFEELYIYLSARANGALPPGRPKQLK